MGSKVRRTIASVFTAVVGAMPASCQSPRRPLAGSKGQAGRAGAWWAGQRPGRQTAGARRAERWRAERRQPRYFVPVLIDAELSDVAASPRAGHWPHRPVGCADWGRQKLSTQLHQLCQMTSMSTGKTRRGARGRRGGVLPTPGAGGLLNKTLLPTKGSMLGPDPTPPGVTPRCHGPLGKDGLASPVLPLTA